MWNPRGPVDARRVFTGKDGLLFDEFGRLLATVETYQVQTNITNAKYQPLGDAQEHEVFQGYSVTLNFTEVVIEDNVFIEERMIFRDCVPSGNIDLQNVSVGDLIKRQWSLFVNRPPELQNLLSY